MLMLKCRRFKMSDVVARTLPPCCLQPTRVVIRRRKGVKRINKLPSTEAGQDQIIDKPCSAYISAVHFDTKNAPYTSLHPSELQFWSLVHSNTWISTIRVGKGYLQKRLHFAIHELTKKGVLLQCSTALSYRKCDLVKDTEQWIPDHRVSSSLKICDRDVSLIITPSK